MKKVWKWEQWLRRRLWSQLYHTVTVLARLSFLTRELQELSAQGEHTHTHTHTHTQGLQNSGRPMARAEGFVIITIHTLWYSKLTQTRKYVLQLSNLWQRGVFSSVEPMDSELQKSHLRSCQWTGGKQVNITDQWKITQVLYTPATHKRLHDRTISWRLRPYSLHCTRILSNFQCYEK